jgi:hypothetical protein
MDQGYMHERGTDRVLTDMGANDAPKYCIPMSNAAREEIDALGVDPDSPKTRAEWWLIAHACMGKSRRIMEGEYGPDETPGESAAWCADLNELAESIFGHKPD